MAHLNGHLKQGLLDLNKRRFKTRNYSFQLLYSLIVHALLQFQSKLQILFQEIRLKVFIAILYILPLCQLWIVIFAREVGFVWQFYWKRIIKNKQITETFMPIISENIFLRFYIQQIYYSQDTYYFIKSLNLGTLIGSF